MLSLRQYELWKSAAFYTLGRYFPIYLTFGFLRNILPLSWRFRFISYFLDLLAIYLSDPVKCEVVVMPGIACSFVCYTN